MKARTGRHDQFTWWHVPVRILPARLGAGRLVRSPCSGVPNTGSGWFPIEKAGASRISANMSRIVHIEIDDSALPPPTPEIEQERRVAIFDLLEDNSFTLMASDARKAPMGPYRLQLAIYDRLLVFDVRTESGKPAVEFRLSLGPFRQVVKDYYQICESYFDAVKRLPPGQIEAIDMARRGIHNEGARILEERLDGKVELDIDTARRLFTLICVLHFGA